MKVLNSKAPVDDLAIVSWAFEQGYKMGMSDAKDGIFADITETVSGFVEGIEEGVEEDIDYCGKRYVE